MLLLSAPVRLEPASAPSARLPDPVLRLKSAPSPKAELFAPDVLAASASKPKAELRLAVVLAASALAPKAEFCVPVVVAASAALPKADWPLPVVLAVSAVAPIAVLLPVLVMVRFPAEAPTKVLLVPKLCRNGVAPKVITPTEAEVVLGRVSEPVRLRLPVTLWSPVKVLLPVEANALGGLPASVAAFTLVSPEPFAPFRTAVGKVPVRLAAGTLVRPAPLPVMVPGLSTSRPPLTEPAISRLAWGVDTPIPMKPLLKAVNTGLMLANPTLLELTNRDTSPTLKVSVPQAQFRRPAKSVLSRARKR